MQPGIEQSLAEVAGRGLGKAGADVGGHSGWKSTPASSLPLAALGLSAVQESQSQSATQGDWYPDPSAAAVTLGTGDAGHTLLPPPTLG